MFIIFVSFFFYINFEVIVPIPKRKPKELSPKKKKQIEKPSPQQPNRSEKIIQPEKKLDVLESPTIKCFPSSSPEMISSPKRGLSPRATNIMDHMVTSLPLVFLRVQVSAICVTPSHTLKF